MNKSEKLLNHIKEDQIQPIAKWKFTARKIATWAFYTAFVIIGSLAFSVILYTIQQSDFNLLSHIQHSKMELLLVLAPLVWIGMLIFFLIGSVLSAQYSERGYKFTFTKLIAFSTAFSMLLGTLFFITGGAKYFETSFANNIEMYNSLLEKKMKIWTNPEEGNLAGEIISYNEKSIELLDFYQNKWTITLDSAFIAPMALIEKGEKIKLNGTISGEGIFEASHIRPWGGGYKGKRSKGKGKNRKN